jgi:hypothetical protein
VDIVPEITVQGGLSVGDELYLEVIDPDVWGRDASLTADQRAELGTLGFTEANNCVLRTPAGQDPAGLAAEILTRVMEDVFDVPPDAPLPYMEPEAAAE